MSENPKKIEVITGNGKELDISPVYEHIATDKPKSVKRAKQEIVVPNTKEEDKKKKKK